MDRRITSLWIDKRKFYCPTGNPNQVPEKVKGYENSKRNRILKVLEDTNIKVSTFMSNGFGVSGRLMLDALVNGEVIEPAHVADMAKGKLRSQNTGTHTGIKQSGYLTSS